jgi:hypothetical protein
MKALPKIFEDYLLAPNGSLILTARYKIVKKHAIPIKEAIT